MSDPDRSTYLGSSDAAAVLGLSRWRTRLDVYRSKVHPASVADPDADRLKLFRRGKLLEPVIREMAVEDFGLEVSGLSRRHTDTQHDWMRAEIDFEIREDGEFFNCECKSVSPFSVQEWGDADTADIPIEYYSQVMYGLMVTGRRRCYVFALFGSDNLVRYIVDRDDEAIDGMREAVTKFWTEHVVFRVPPEPTTAEDVAYLFRKVRGRRITATEEMAEAINKYRLLGHKIKSFEDEREVAFVDATRRILEACKAASGDPAPDEDAEVFDTANGRLLATYKKQRGAYLDQQRLKSEHPDLHAELMVEHFYRVLRPRDPIKPSRRK